MKFLKECFKREPLQMALVIGGTINVIAWIVLFVVCWD
jgi:hypothetical protein